MKKFKTPIWIACLALTVGAIVAATTNAPAQLNSLPAITLPGINWSNVVLAVLVPFGVAAVKKLIPSVPSQLLPVVAVLLGALGDALSASVGFANTINPVAGGLVGAAGVGVREVYDQNKHLLLKPDIAVILALCLLPFIALGCDTIKLAPGGAYNPTQTNAVTGEVTAKGAPDAALLIVDTAYNLAYATVDDTFAFERNNRALLFREFPKFKHTLDQLRPAAVQFRLDYARARTAYLAVPNPGSLSTMQNVLAQVQKLAAALTAALVANECPECPGATNGVVPFSSVQLTPAPLEGMPLIYNLSPAVGTVATANP